jgi:amino acid transporter
MSSGAYYVIGCKISMFLLLGTLLLSRSFIGYSNANYAMGEMKNPIKTIKRAGPIAMGSVTVLYLLM